MSAVTPIGFVVIPLGIVLFFLRRRYLTLVTVAAIPFFFAYPFGHVEVFQWFGGLLIVRQLLAIVRARKTPRPSPAATAMLAFLGVAAASLAMPLLLRGEVAVVTMHTSYAQYGNVTLLHFRLQNLTQFAFPVFGVALCLALIRDFKDEELLYKARTVFLASSFGVLASGLAYQFLVMTVGPVWVMPLFWAFTGKSSFTTILGQTMYDRIGRLPRMFSLAGEPAYTGLLLLVAWGLLIAGIGDHRTRKRARSLGAAALTVGIILTGSTTAYAGLLMGLCVLVILPNLRGSRAYRGRFQRTALLVGSVLAVAGAVVIMLGPHIFKLSFFDYLANTQWSKLQGEAGSSVGRLSSAQYTLKTVFAKSPILGVGYGSHRNASLLIFLLSNVGSLGLIAYVAFNGRVILDAVRVYRRSQRIERLKTVFGCMVGFAAAVPASLGASGAVGLMYGWYWLLLAFMESIYQVERSGVRRSG